MTIDTAIPIAALLVNPDDHVARIVAVRGRLQGAGEGVHLVDTAKNVSLKVDITLNNLMSADRKGWLLVGGGRPYDFDGWVEGVLLRDGESFMLSEIKKIHLENCGETNEIDPRDIAPPGPRTIEV
jgi:hypothetical protein